MNRCVPTIMDRASRERTLLTSAVCACHRWCRSPRAGLVRERERLSQTGHEAHARPGEHVKSVHSSSRRMTVARRTRVPGAGVWPVTRRRPGCCPRCLSRSPIAAVGRLPLTANPPEQMHVRESAGPVPKRRAVDVGHGNARIASLRRQPRRAGAPRAGEHGVTEEQGNRPTPHPPRLRSRRARCAFAR
jgi:hypothetical protein